MAMETMMNGWESGVASSDPGGLWLMVSKGGNEGSCVCRIVAAAAHDGKSTRMPAVGNSSNRRSVFMRVSGILFERVTKALVANAMPCDLDVRNTLKAKGLASLSGTVSPDVHLQLLHKTLQKLPVMRRIEGSPEHPLGYANAWSGFLENTVRMP